MEKHIQQISKQLKKRQDFPVEYSIMIFFMMGAFTAFFYDKWSIAICVGIISLIAHYSLKIMYTFKRYNEEKVVNLYEIKNLRALNKKKDEIIADTTNLKMSNELLQEANEEFGKIFNAVEEVLFSMDIIGRRLIQVSAACSKVFGYSPIEFIANNELWFKVVHADDMHIIDENYQNLKKGKTVSRKYRIIHKDGNIRWIEAKVIPTVDQKGFLIRIDGICNDITKRVKLANKLAEEKRKQQQQITNAAITAQENERSFLGEELHDNINPILATAKLYMECAISEDHKEKWPELIRDSRGFISTAMEEIRILSRSLVPPSLGEIGLVDAIKDMLESIEKVNDIKFVTNWKSLNESLLSDKLKLTIFRILQEQLNNILKHAHATTVHISLKKHNTLLQLSIKDDGVGFDASQKRNGVGLQNIISRTELFNGTVAINTEPGHGCELLVSFISQPELPFIKNI